MSFSVQIQSTKFLYERLNKAKIYAFGSTEPVELKGKFEVLVDSKRRVAAATFYITKGTQETTSILCCETSTNLHLITMNVNSVSKASEVTSDSGTDTSSCDLDASKRKENLLKGRHPNVFTGIGKLKGHEQKIHINTDVPPNFCRINIFGKSGWPFGKLRQ